MNITILAENKFYALGLRSLIVNSDDTFECKIMNTEWHKELIKEDIIISKCYFSSDGSHLKLLKLMSMLSVKKWKGKILLITNKNNISLVEYFIKRYYTLKVFCINENDAIDSKVQFFNDFKVTSNKKKTPTLNDCEFIVISLLACGLRGRDISKIIKLPEKVVSRHKVNALNKLNVNRLLYLFISRQ